MQRSIKVDETTWERLMRIKLVSKYKSIDDTINGLFEKAGFPSTKTAATAATAAAAPEPKVAAVEKVAFEVIPNVKTDETETWDGTTKI